MLFVLAQSVDGCHILHIDKHILAHSLLETRLSNNNSASCIILHKTIVVDDPPTGMPIIIKSPNFSDVILQYALHQHLALCRVFPFWIAEPNHLVTPIIIGAPVVLKRTLYPLLPFHCMAAICKVFGSPLSNMKCFDKSIILLLNYNI